MSLLRAIGQGERDPQALARLREHRGKESAETIAQALQGTWQPEHRFALQQSLALSDSSHQQIRDCDRGIEAHLKGMAFPEVPPLAPKRRGRRRKDNEVTFDARQRLHQVAGVDLTAIEGLEESPALVGLREVGTDMHRWPSEKHCGSWLGLAPHPKKSGGKVKASATRPGSHRAAQALRLAAKNVQRSQSALETFCRRIAARRGVAEGDPSDGVQAGADCLRDAAAWDGVHGAGAGGVGDGLPGAGGTAGEAEGSSAGPDGSRAGRGRATVVRRIGGSRGEARPSH